MGDPDRTGSTHSETGRPTGSEGQPSLLRWPRVSIVTPSYNQGQFLEETICSVLSQDYPNLEYIVIDGGSTDGSGDILQRYSSRLAFWVSERDRGQADALNKGFAHATGDILAWLNSDDVYRAQAVSRAVAHYQAHDEADLVYGACDLIDGQSQFLGRLVPYEFTLAQQLVQNPIAQPATFFRRAVLDAVGGFNIEHHYAFDLEFWLQAALRKFRFSPLGGAPLAGFRMWQESKSEGSTIRFVPEMQEILEAAFADPRLPPNLGRLKGRAQSGAWRFAAYGSYRSGEVANARRSLGKMVALSPRTALDPEIVLLYAKTLLGSALSQQLRGMRRRLVRRLHKP